MMLLGYLLRSAATPLLAVSKSSLTHEAASYTCATLNAADVVRLLGHLVIGRAGAKNIQPCG